MAANIPLPKKIYGHGWILSDEKKMSKSLGNILDPIEIINKYGIDQLRYYLIKEVSLGNDGNISLKNLKDCINNDLANNFGNLCQRVFTFVEKNCSNKIPKSKSFDKIDLTLTDNLIKNVPNLIENMNNQKLNTYLNSVIGFSFDANKYFNDLKPWELKTKDPKRMDAVLNTIITQIKNISILLNPVIPIATNNVLDFLNIPIEKRKIAFIKDKDVFDYEKKLNKFNILFKKIENDN